MTSNFPKATIPSPTPIKGVQNPDGTAAPPGQRLPLAELQQNEFAFALYAQALLNWQRDGSEIKDPDASTGTSYFQVAGVHGIPYVPWQDDPTPSVINNWGYCTHKSVLFVPWHRPYLMLYEQIIYQYALEIVNQSEGWAKQAYTDVLEYVRLPYWDFNRDPSLPEAVKSPTLTVIVPGGIEGQKKSLPLERNPFYSYKFTSDYAWKLISERLEWDQRSPDDWVQESKRCPDANGVSQPDIADKQMKKVGKDYKARAYSLLTSVQDFAEFTCMAYKPGTNYDSVEVWHNYVHNYTGTNDKGDFGFYPLGNLTDVQSSSFDPIFWLLHCHVDRIAAIWQSMHYDRVNIGDYKSQLPRYTAAKDTIEGGASHLEPWHTNNHTKDDYWIANATKDVESTFSGGYYYPETPLSLRNDPQALQAYTIDQVNRIYAPAPVLNMISAAPVAGAAPEGAATAAEEAPQEEPEPAEEQPVPSHLEVTKPSQPIDTPMQDVINPIDTTPLITNPVAVPADVKPIRSVEWRAFVRVKGFAVQGTWGIHLFFGSPPANSSEWFMSDKRVGTVNVLSNEDLSACPNCEVQSASGLLVTGIVLLTNELLKRDVDIFNREAVVEFLKKELTWVVAKDAQNVDITPEMSLTVGVAARDVAYPVESNQLPVWGEVSVYPDATKGKVGGLETDVEEV